jgi:Na+/proline symporter
LILDQFDAQRGPFGAIPHPLEPLLLLLHGISSIAAMYLLGWITSRHVLRWWTSGMRRLSGSVLAAMFVLLVVSGFALFFVSEDEWQHGAAVVHEVLGVAITAFAVQHWFFRGRREP